MKFSILFILVIFNISNISALSLDDPNYSNFSYFEENYEEEYRAPNIWDLIGDVGGIYSADNRPPRVRGNGGQPHGCVTEDTLITLADGNKVPIKTLLAGDLVLNQFQNSVASKYIVTGKAKKSLVKITTESGRSIKATLGHPFFDREGISRADSFKDGDDILTVKGFEAVISVEIISYKGNVYNLAVTKPDLFFIENLEKRDPFLGLTSSEHTVLLNGFVSGDIVLQTLIANKND